ncbi:hypothetical protein ACHAW5_005585 [Stephanodiscus triporus]|uniref:Uncharacterized protein n=1 Tax=Stephanodiscus triporus TaxID=2934178 RepID=A0ABD3PWT5_9STRA
MSSIVRSIVALVLAQYCCADSLHLPNNFNGDEASGSSALCMIDYSLGQADMYLMNPQTVKIPKTLPFATTHADGNVILTTTNYVAPPLIDWNLLATHASFAAAPVVAISRMISVIIGGASPQLMIIQGGKMASMPSPTILMCSALEECSTSHVSARGKEGTLAREEAILRGLGRADANQMTSQTLEISKTHSLAETYAIGNNALRNEDECALALAVEETINGLEDTACEAVIELSTNLGWAPMHWLYGNMHQIDHQLQDLLHSLVLYQAMSFVAISVISAVICFILGSIRLSKIIVSGRRIIMMKPSAVVMSLTLAACFAGHADASFNYSGGLCLKRASGLDRCTANDVQARVTNYTGPPNCTAGEIITINITTEITVTATNRYDLGIYLGINGANALSDQGNTSCLVQTLGESDSIHNDGRVNNTDGDDCWDLNDKNGTIVGFEINNFDYQCNAGEDGKAVLYACFAWDQNKNTYCPSICNSTSGQTLCLNPGTEAVSSAPPCQ